MAIDLEKLKAAALASINHDGSNYYSHTYNYTKASNPATILELIERLEAAEKQRDELMAAIDHFVTWARGQHRAQSKGCHSTFDMLMLRDEIDFAEQAIASVKERK